ncbi:helix-turn-helix transcriptional regulator [Variovorax ginsengisoli]|uniref:WYL domain-containing protein n=1 Tax=Variovorax ginsengisoli TaxID=363844 RepID=A0ABT8SDN2_9BURK|nr:WYL domain-containing protein [Variovorax ginsengisoli]MDN8617279.1 WYL domain-containing protein [Variovorax ginsengisoli]MDO1536449.1 WYL domain-containing protein [Variovorax ginsengisoli]
MTQRASNLDTLLMSLEMLKRIPRVGKISAPELHRQLFDAGFARDLRTVQRQLELLSEHFDIERDERSKPYGYCWKSHTQAFSVAHLNEQESVLLSLAEQHLRHLLPAGLMRSMQGFFEQARVQLGPDQRGRPARSWLDKVRVVGTTQPLLPPKVQPEVFEAVSNALYADRWLDVSYGNAAGKQVEGRVMPLGLAQQGPRLFLVCRFEGYEDDRALALHRLRSAHDSGLPFERPAGFDLQRYDDEGRFGFGAGKRIELVFRLPAETALHLTESPLSHDQRVRILPDGRSEFTATVVESSQLRWWLRGFGSALELRKPRRLLDD